MTFKHVKFEDSAVMRSLERMAREKGLVPTEPARVKTASAPDLGFPQSSTLMENILRLCAGLRHAGFEKHATEVEEKFLAFKQAQTLYETSGEKGEDLVDAAHPKGSHKLEDVAGDDLAVVETIIDQHLKHLKMIEKTPTGKLANNNQILDAVKVVLADNPLVVDKETGLTQPVIDNIMGFFKNIDESIGSWSNYIIGVNNDGVLAYNRLKANTIKHINNHTISNVTIGQINGMIDEAIKGFSSRSLSTGFLISTPAENILFQLKSLKNYMSDIVTDDHKSLINATKAVETEKSNSPFQQALGQIDALKEKIEGWLLYGVIRKSQVASNWIKEESDVLKALKETYSKATPAQQGPALTELQKELASELRDINDFESKWIKA